MGLSILAPALEADDVPSLQSDNSDSDGGMSIDADDIDDRPKKRVRLGDHYSSKTIVVPGEAITDETQWMRGHGTMTSNADPTSTTITATLAGPVRPTNKLLSVLPLRARYIPEIGDLVIGRIVEVQKNRWKVDVAAPLLAQLSMSSINLPGGALRRRTTADELQMRNYFQEGDLLVAEVQTVGSSDGVATLHARSLKYGKLKNGTFLAVSGTGGGGGVVRSRRQVFTINSGAQGGGDVDVILGVNGYVWLSKHTEAGANVAKGGGMSISNLDDVVGSEAYSSQNELVAEGTRREIARIGECIKALAEGGVRVDEETTIKAYNAAVEYSLTQPDTEEVGHEGGRELLNMNARQLVVAAVVAP